METSNPYSPPQGEVQDQEIETAPIKIFSAKGRIGRLRYIGYSMGIALLCYLAVGILSVAMGAFLPDAVSMPVIVTISGLGLVAVLLISVLLTIQRCHDFNVTGWLSLILLVPLAPFIFWIIPGTRGANNFGPPPPPNRGGIVAVVTIVVALGIISILAAIAIPAYQAYLLKAESNIEIPYPK